MCEGDGASLKVGGSVVVCVLLFNSRLREVQCFSGSKSFHHTFDLNRERSVTETNYTSEVSTQVDHPVSSSSNCTFIRKNLV